MPVIISVGAGPQQAKRSSVGELCRQYEPYALCNARVAFSSNGVSSSVCHTGHVRVNPVCFGACSKVASVLYGQVRMTNHGGPVTDDWASGI